MLPLDIRRRLDAEACELSRRRLFRRLFRVVPGRNGTAILINRRTGEVAGIIAAPTPGREEPNF